jgi:transposase
MNTTELENIVRDIDNGCLNLQQILDKYHITQYKYSKIVKEYGLKKDYVVSVDNEYRKKPKNTKFKQLLSQTDRPPDPSTFSLDDFKNDCKDGMKITELMDKHHLSLYQIRELRKKYDLKTK